MEDRGSKTQEERQYVRSSIFDPQSSPMLGQLAANAMRTSEDVWQGSNTEREGSAVSRSPNTWRSSMSGNPEFVVLVPTDGPQADATLREQRESLRDILASTADVVLATDSARPLVPKLQLGNDREQAAHALEVSEVRYRRPFEPAQDA